MQGTLYPDVVESGGTSGDAAIIKTHHNVGGLPDDMEFELVEPLRDLFKDEVRAVGEELGLPEDIVWRQPFPGPGLAVRIIGDSSPGSASRSCAGPTPSSRRRSSGPACTASSGRRSPCCRPCARSGVMGDERTYAYPIVIRAVTSEDAMTADWARLPYELLERMASRHHQRGPGRQPGGLRRHVEAARHHRMGVAPGGAPAPRVDAVVFDLGNVLVQWDPRHLYRKLLATDDEVEAFLADVCTPEWNEAQDRGRPFAEGIEEAIGRHPQHEPLIRAFWERWDEMCPGLVDGTVAVLDELHAAGIPLYALSNWSLETFERVRHGFDFLDRFDGLVISAAERLVKPEPAIFELLLSRYGLAAGRTAFVDDAAPQRRRGRRPGLRGVAVHGRGAPARRPGGARTARRGVTRAGLSPACARPAASADRRRRWAPAAC